MNELEQAIELLTRICEAKRALKPWVTFSDDEVRFRHTSIVGVLTIVQADVMMMIREWHIQPCSVCGCDAVAQVGETYFLCEECVREKIEDSIELQSKLDDLIEKDREREYD